MTTREKIGLGVGLALLAFTAAFMGGKLASGTPTVGGGGYTALPTWFGNGLSAGTSEQFSIASNGSLTTTGTTTVAASYDGYGVYDDFTVTATGTAKAVYTNTYGPAVCTGADGIVWADATGFAPSLVFSLGTSTSATGYSTNLLASTTVATSTDTLIRLTNHAFILGAGESIVGAISDITNALASTTHMSNWSVQFSVKCRLIGA